MFKAIFDRPSKQAKVEMDALDLKDAAAVAKEYVKPAAFGELALDKAAKELSEGLVERALFSYMGYDMDLYESLKTLHEKPPEALEKYYRSPDSMMERHLYHRRSIHDLQGRFYAYVLEELSGDLVEDIKDEIRNQ